MHVLRLNTTRTTWDSQCSILSLNQNCGCTTVSQLIGLASNIYIYIVCLFVIFDKFSYLVSSFGLHNIVYWYEGAIDWPMDNHSLVFFTNKSTIFLSALKFSVVFKNVCKLGPT